MCKGTCQNHALSRTVHKSGVLPVQACRRPQSFLRAMPDVEHEITLSHQENTACITSKSPVGKAPDQSTLPQLPQYRHHLSGEPCLSQTGLGQTVWGSSCKNPLACAHLAVAGHSCLRVDRRCPGSGRGAHSAAWKCTIITETRVFDYGEMCA